MSKLNFDIIFVQTNCVCVFLCCIDRYNEAQWHIHINIVYTIVRFCCSLSVQCLLTHTTEPHRARAVYIDHFIGGTK